MTPTHIVSQEELQVVLLQDSRPHWTSSRHYCKHEEMPQMQNCGTSLGYGRQPRLYIKEKDIEDTFED